MKIEVMTDIKSCYITDYGYYINIYIRILNEETWEVYSFPNEEWFESILTPSSWIDNLSGIYLSKNNISEYFYFRNGPYSFKLEKDNIWIITVYDDNKIHRYKNIDIRYFLDSLLKVIKKILNNIQRKNPERNEDIDYMKSTISDLERYIKVMF